MNPVTGEKPTQQNPPPLSQVREVTPLPLPFTRSNSFSEKRGRALTVETEERFIAKEKWDLVRKLVRQGVFKRVDSFLSQCSALGDLLEENSWDRVSARRWDAS